MTQPLESGELSLPREALIELMQAALAGGAPLSFRARGWSMTPLIRDGDVICVAPLSQAGPAVGDVVAFVRAQTGQLVVHRVIARRNDASTIQGDNTPGVRDLNVARVDILGRVTRVTRNGREVRLGLGPERSLIAAFSRAGWLGQVRTLLAGARRGFK